MNPSDGPPAKINSHIHFRICLLKAMPKPRFHTFSRMNAGKIEEECTALYKRGYKPAKGSLI